MLSPDEHRKLSNLIDGSRLPFHIDRRGHNQWFVINEHGGVSSQIFSKCLEAEQERDRMNDIFKDHQKQLMQQPRTK